MNNATADFNRRLVEIQEYVSHLEQMEQQIGIAPSLMSTMKASAVLMIYNMTESTMTNIAQAVFDHLQQTNINLSTLNDTMKVLVIKNIKKRDPKKLVEKMRASSLDISIASFERSDVFSGNVDSEKIRKSLAEFGVIRPGKFTEAVLLEIKTARNDLAHGTKSFSDAGRNYTARDLKIKLTKVENVLNRALSTYQNYIQTRAYA